MVEQEPDYKDKLEPDYMDELYELREYLKLLLNKEFLQSLVALAEMIDRSYVDSYCRIKENSEYKGDCGYAIKCRDIFERLQGKPIEKKITYIYKTFLEPR